MRRYPHSQLQVIAVSFSQKTKGFDVAFHKLTEVLATDAAQETCLNKMRKDALYVWFGFFLIILGKTLTNGQSPCPDLFIKAPFLILWFSCECSCGGRGEKKKTLELEEIEKI